MAIIGVVQSGNLIQACDEAGKILFVVVLSDLAPNVPSFISCVFRAKADSNSDGLRTLIPTQAGQ